MKNILLLSIVAICITACAPDTKDPYIGTKIYGYSNDVIFELGNVHNDSGSLPSQVKVNLEKPDPKFSKLRVIPFIEENAPYPQDTVVKIGCDGASQDMPEVLEVHTIILCGDLYFEKQNLNYTANTIILISANIKIVSTYEDLKYLGVNLRAQSKIILKGRSVINLQGRARPNNAGLETPPRLTMATKLFDEEGSLEVTSKANYLIYGK
ncbi:hypothetical protein AZI86_02070 [Bdellovibrio bacteriovorus]|uniref:Lipoprotein n=1 Tax=Bdellovibrio bacteriovorus TaxID=959 RepID=A0A150WN47_BDEBC|nr:hypothetical protein [Bdellovibrio bacteriovorus]KYG65882.1 hypothetical protein AZI86_02070 [Bdellovibrio bacteriovorus]